MESRRDQIVKALRGDGVEACKRFLSSSSDAGDGPSLLIVGDDAREVVRISTKAVVLVLRFSCLRSGLGEEFAEVWDERKETVIVEDLDQLQEVSSKNLLTALIGNKLDEARLRPELPPKIVGVASELSKVPPPLLRSGRFDYIVDLTAPPDLNSRRKAFQVLTTSICAEELATLTPGYSSKDFFRLIHELGVERLNENRLSLQAIPPPRQLLVSESRKVYGWDVIAGYDEEKQAVRRALEWPFVHSDTLSSLGVKPVGGILLHGPSGCGKSLMANAAGAELLLANFIHVKPSSLLSKYLGDTEARIRSLFARARAMLPCVIFIDEIDSLCRKRDSDEEFNLDRRIIGSLLTELDGIAGSRRAFILACTNRFDLIDPALLRPGRIDQLLEIPMPGFKNRKAVLKHHASRLGFDDDLLHNISQATAGASCATLQSIMRQTAMNSLRDSSAGVAQKVTLDHLNKSLTSHNFFSFNRNLFPGAGLRE
ncbi:hypothetical protein NDN08_007762 [Rhodosorus marinus]|uniref:AAA+ ATPase domain-containing protein n=1 Tax=Rhodosorus marinus TaxID=101924 RepID=A0AAV8UYG7_9RHOD|nr:hypothetical protein NDN08_007762 [Rhodosorus marinus]